MEKEVIRMKCDDGVELAGRLILPGSPPKAVVQFNSASATKKEFYDAFATYLAEQGFAALYYDNRGICESQPAEGLKGCTYEVIDWGIKDMKTVIAYLRNRFPTLPLVVVGHSSGGQLMGFPENLHEVTGLITFGSAAGHWGTMPLGYRLQTHLFFEIIRPYTHWKKGYTAVKRWNIMEDIPPRITNTWRKWCSKPDYFFDASTYPALKPLSHYQAIPFPIKVLWASDDAIATDTNVHNFWRHVHSQQGIGFRKLTPKHFGLQRIGHFGLFPRAFRNTLWPIMLEEIEAMLKRD